MTSKVFAYGRVSTDEQTADNQLLEIRSAGYPIEPEYWFADEGVSGKTPALERPQFAKMLHKIRKGETLVVSKIDRLGRDSVDVLQTVRHLQDMGARVVVLQLGNTDLTSPAGKLMLTMLSAVAEMERTLIVERTKAGQARAWAEGKTKGRPSKTSAGQRKEILERLSKNDSVSAVARDYGISRASVISIRDGAI
ncbi:recombinase family protein [Methylovorus glucosotrophus]|uniref:Resolvase domain protein n=1 Tax=Methylovorus glucosotrophus (strain SIP3-4) TaxID=582744 RepID=C6XDU6_METGS|nr:recombinase family protein [Methylovorus glucosotrophus]ACT50721.1 Resolvase domain protein [Methylovorus glucosotrophus SIP3-4]